jgi:predicted PurR-regulated permease PerM
MNINSAWGMRLADALEDSISSVLVATMKLSLFHGLFTWLTHTVFGAHVVYLPAILASILAAAPFLECYWCVVPAFLDLWLSQDRFYLGLVLFLIHFIVPSNFNPVVHSEIKGGGHPYLTVSLTWFQRLRLKILVFQALSIVGGMYLFGIEGAVLGPLLLCLLVVLSTITVNNLNTPTNSFTHQSSIDGSNSIATPAT